MQRETHGTAASYTQYVTGTGGGTITITPNDILGGRIVVIDSITAALAGASAPTKLQIYVGGNNSVTGANLIMSVEKSVALAASDYIHLGFANGLPVVNSSGGFIGNNLNALVNITTDTGFEAITGTVTYHFRRGTSN